MLPDGKEVIYGFLSDGDKLRADAALEDVWDIGPRAAPAKLSPITWADDPADKYWRFIFYGLRPLSNLLYAYYTTGNAAYRDKLLEVLRSFNAFDGARGSTPNEFLDDPHTSAFRAMMLVDIYGKLSRTNDLPADVAAGMRTSIAKVSAFLSLEENFEDDQNHGFNEAAALLVAAENFPDMEHAAEWRTLALARLGKLAGDTIDDDGVETENSPFYHFYVLTFMQEDLRWMNTYGVPAPAGFADRVTRMFDYATYSTQPDGFAPLLGASVKLNVAKLLPRLYESNSLDQMPGLESLSPAFTYVRSLGKDGTAPPLRSKRFDVSGQGFVRSAFSDADSFKADTWLSFNVGNHRSAHNHYDALGLTYYGSGKVLVPDAGLYQYGSVRDPQPMTEYFLSTRAHNTVVVDGIDQLHASDETHRATGGAVLEGADWAYQSGTHTLYDGVTHRRAVLVMRRDLTLVLDTLESKVAHDYVQTWHLEPGASMTSAGLDVTAVDAAGAAELSVHQVLTGGISLEAVKGREGSVPQGWFSEKYGAKTANWALEYRAHAARTSFATLLASGPYASAHANVTVTRSEAGTTAMTICVGDASLDVAVTNPSLPGETVTVAPSGSCP